MREWCSRCHRSWLMAPPRMWSRRRRADGWPRRARSPLTRQCVSIKICKCREESASRALPQLQQQQRVAPRVGSNYRPALVRVQLINATNTSCVCDFLRAWAVQFRNRYLQKALDAFTLGQWKLYPHSPGINARIFLIEFFGVITVICFITEEIFSSISFAKKHGCRFKSANKIDLYFGVWTHKNSFLPHFCLLI